MKLFANRLLLRCTAPNSIIKIDCELAAKYYKALLFSIKYCELPKALNTFKNIIYLHSKRKVVLRVRFNHMFL